MALTEMVTDETAEIDEEGLEVELRSWKIPVPTHPM